MKSLLAFLGGAVAGAAIAILIAPEKGEVTRRKIRETVDQGVEKIREKIDHNIEAIEKKAQEVRRKANHESREKIAEVAEAAHKL